MGNFCVKKRSRRVVSLKLSDLPQKISAIEENMPETFHSGRQIQWKRGEMIAEGRFCKIFQCMNIKTGESLIVKSYPTSRSSSNFIHELKKIKKETRILKVLSHKGVIKLFQSETSKESIDLVMECIPGGCLQEIIAKYGALEPEIVKNYLKQLIETVAYLHSIGISHNNIRAESIFITSDGKLKLSGFKNFTYTGETIEIDELYLKPCIFHQFLAPEATNSQVSPLSDVWSIGCLAIQLATGRAPFNSLSSDQDSIVKVLNTKDFQLILPNPVTSLNNFIEKCLKIDLSERISLKDLIKHEAISGKKFSFDMPGDDSLKMSLSRTVDCHNPIVELSNE